MVNDIFDDIKESEFLTELDGVRLSDNQRFFVSVPEQNPSDSSEKSVDDGRPVIYNI